MKNQGDFNCIYDEEIISEKRTDFWKNINLDNLKMMDNKDLYSLFENEYPRKEIETTKFDWMSFNKGLKQNGIEYVSNNSTKLVNDLSKKEEIISKSDFKLELTINGQFDTNRFAILDKEGNSLWYGKDFDAFYDNQFGAELDTAKKAIWVADQIKNQQGLNSMVLVLKTDNAALTYQTKIEQKNQKSKEKEI